MPKTDLRFPTAKKSAESKGVRDHDEKGGPSVAERLSALETKILKFEERLEQVVHAVATSRMDLL